MTDNHVAGSPESDPLKSVADAMETAVQAARDGAADAKAAVDRAIPAISQFVSRFVYTTSYSLSYGVVFPAMLLARAVPKDNALVHGLVDGAAGGEGYGGRLEGWPGRPACHRGGAVGVLRAGRHPFDGSWRVAVPLRRRRRSDGAAQSPARLPAIATMARAAA